MATIIQINRVNTNRSGAVSDVVSRLQSDQVANRVTINAQNIPLGTGLTVGSDGNINASAQAINLSDVETFTDANARNAHATTEWHEGDVAILIADASVTEGGTTPVSTGYSVLSVPNNNQFVVPGGYDRTADEFRADLPNVGDIVRFDSGGGNFRGSTTGGTNFTITARERTNPGNDQVTFTVDRSLVSPDTVPAVAGAEEVFAGEAGTTTIVSEGTYIYTGTDQTTAGVTTNADWTLLRTPTATNLPASAITSGTFDEARIPAAIARTNQLRTLTFAQSGNLVTGNANLTENAQNEVTAIAIAAFSGLTEFPAEVAIFVNGIKVAGNEVSFNVGRTTATFSTPIEFPVDGGLTLTFELMYLS